MDEQIFIWCKTKDVCNTEHGVFVCFVLSWQNLRRWNIKGRMRSSPAELRLQDSSHVLFMLETHTPICNWKSCKHLLLAVSCWLHVLTLSNFANHVINARTSYFLCLVEIQKHMQKVVMLQNEEEQKNKNTMQSRSHAQVTVTPRSYC